ncbi:MAG: TRAP transporter large permease subunit [Hyphomicrobiaceae bacterium]|nr:TRAP transporter large permease subunit [Hyphomicrobiaceae bacterium]
MEAVGVAIVLLVTLLGLLGLGIWIAIALLAVGLIGIGLFTAAPLGITMANQVWAGMASWTLTALPLFIWMGEILFRSRLASDMFRGLVPWMRRLPGQLLHANVIGSGIFASFSGSSSATCAAMARVTLPELERRSYPASISIGSLSGASTLGLLIPPSIIMIVYGASAEVSIAKLFIAGILPGIMLMALFSGYIVVWALLNRHRLELDTTRTTLVEKIAASRFAIPVFMLVGLVIGSIYAGIATPTEAAALGVAAALVLSFLTGTLTWRSFSEGLMSAMVTSTMIMLIVAGATFLTAAMGYTGLPRHLVAWVTSFELSVGGLLMALTVVFLILGCFIDGISIVVLTTAILLPTVEAAGIDLIWFGIFMVLIVEMSMITPPVGFNLFVLQALTGRSVSYIARATLPFFVLMILAVALITVFPSIVLYLPARM